MPAAARGIGVTLLAAFLALLATPVAAHTDLVSSRPADGAVLAEGPPTVSARFGEDVLPAGARLVAEDASGTAVDLGPARVAGSRVSAAWPAEAGEGVYTVEYRVAGLDGHPLEGSFTFTVEPVGAGPSDPSTPSAQPSPAASEEADAGGAPNVLQPVLLVVALAAAGYFVWRSRVV